LVPDFETIGKCGENPGINSNCAWTVTELPWLKVFKLFKFFNLKKADDLADSKKGTELPDCKCFLAGTDVLMGDGGSSILEHPPRGAGRR
jgi:hypothetical protein